MADEFNWNDPNYWGNGAEFGSGANGMGGSFDPGPIVGGTSPTTSGSGYNGADGLDTGYYGPTVGSTGNGSGPDATGGGTNLTVPNDIIPQSSLGSMTDLSNILPKAPDAATGLGLLYAPGFLAQAAKQYQDAGKYQDIGNTAADRADPFGNESRQFYRDEMLALSADPSQIENTPGYKFARDQGLGSLDRQNAAAGYLGAGKSGTDAMTFASGLASQTYDKEMNRLAQLSGSQLDPSKAAQMQMQGSTNAINSENQAMASVGAFLASLLGPKNQATTSGAPTTINNNANGSGTTGGTGSTNPGVGGVGPGQINVGGSGLNLPGQIGSVGTTVPSNGGLSPPPQIPGVGNSYGATPTGFDSNSPEVADIIRQAGLDPTDPSIQEDLNALFGGSNAGFDWSQFDPSMFEDWSGWSDFFGG